MIEKRCLIYARVSTGHQTTGLEAQIRALNEYCQRHGIKNSVIYQDENQSGTKNSRPGLDAMMAAVRNGEASMVLCYSFSRYARSVTHLLRALDEFKALGVGFVSITENIDTSSPLGSAVFTILGAVSQLERDILIERVRNGLANAKSKGVHLGRKKTRPSEMIRALRASGMTYRQISKVCNVSSGAVAAELRLMKEEQKNGTYKPVFDKKPEAPKPTPNTDGLNQYEVPIGEEKIELEIIR